MADPWSVLLGTGSTAIGLAIGSLFERWRDTTRWHRDESSRWMSDLRVLHRDLLASSEAFWAHLDTRARLEERVKGPDVERSEAETFELVQMFRDAENGMIREKQKVLSLSAEMLLIGTKAEAAAASAVAQNVVASTLLHTDSPEMKTAREAYRRANQELISVARASLRRVD